MSRYATPSPAPVAGTFEGDTEFTSVNMKDDRSTLPPGTLALSINKRLRTRRAVKRGGTWPPVFANILGLSSVRGWGVYSNPNGQEVLLVAGPSAVYAMRDGTYPLTIPVEGDLAAAVEFVQAFDTVILFQGLDTRPLSWNGLSPDGFTIISKRNPADTSTTLIPNAVTAEPYASRLLIPDKDDNVLMSDILDYTSYDAILDVFRINAGTADKLIRIFPYSQGNVIMFKGASIDLLSGFSQDPLLASASILSSSLGLAARKAVVQYGADILFLASDSYIYRISQVIQDQITALPVPVSDPIQPLMKRINHMAIAGAAVATLGEYCYFAVPIDGAARNNAVIVYNGATGLIEGYDTFPAPLRIDDFKITFYAGERRLFALDKTAGRIYLMHEGKSDFIYDPGLAAVVNHEIVETMETRGYAFTIPVNYQAAMAGYNAPTRRDFRQVQIALSTWRPSLQVTQLLDGAADERPLNVNPITKSRVVYDRFGKKDFDPTNANGDWAAPGRQDYSVLATDAGFVVRDASGGVNPERKQQSVYRRSTKARGRYVSYRITNSQGDADVCAVTLEAAGTQREPRGAG